MTCASFGKAIQSDISKLIGITFKAEDCGRVQRGSDTSNIQIQKTGPQVFPYALASDRF
jgi:hypothetical protein